MNVSVDGHSHDSILTTLVAARNLDSTRIGGGLATKYQ